MVRRTIPLAIALVVIFGCGKKDESGGGGDGKVDSDPNASYTIKLRAEQAGDKTEVALTQTGSGETSFGGKSAPEKEDLKLEYTEHIIDMPAGAALPNKLTRTYKVAQKYDKKAGTTKALPFEGKTVVIEKKGPGYEFIADGKRLTLAEAGGLAQEFSRKDGRKIDDLLPKGPVKVGEPWTTDPSALKALGDLPFPLHAGKSTITGKLTRAYTKDGKQWGTLTFDCDLVVDSEGKGPSVTGAVKAPVTIDAVIDGSVREGTITTNIKIAVAAKQPNGELKITADMVQTKTVKSAK